MEQSQSSRIRDSPTVQMAAVLTSVYVLFGWLGGDFVTLNIFVALPLVQINSAVRQGSVWMLFTSMFLHANLLHLGGNLLFLLIFGTVLEEQVSRERWLARSWARCVGCHLRAPWGGRWSQRSNRNDFSAGAQPFRRGRRASTYVRPCDRYPLARVGRQSSAFSPWTGLD